MGKPLVVNVWSAQQLDLRELRTEIGLRTTMQSAYILSLDVAERKSSKSLRHWRIA